MTVDISRPFDDAMPRIGKNAGRSSNHFMYSDWIEIIFILSDIIFLSHMEPLPSVSVLMPVYNERRFLKEALDSLKSQTINDFEIILVDDGSDEDVRLQIDEHCRADSR